MAARSSDARSSSSILPDASASSAASAFTASLSNPTPAQSASCSFVCCSSETAPPRKVVQRFSKPEAEDAVLLVVGASIASVTLVNISATKPAARHRPGDRTRPGRRSLRRPRSSEGWRQRGRAALAMPARARAASIKPTPGAGARRRERCAEAPRRTMNRSMTRFLFTFFVIVCSRSRCVDLPVLGAEGRGSSVEAATNTHINELFTQGVLKARGGAEA